MCTYLHGPRAGGMYYFRRGIPARLRPIIGAQEFFVSLGVKDRETAKRLIPGHTAQTQTQLDAAQATLDRTSPSQEAAKPPMSRQGTVVAAPSTQAEADWEQENAAYWSRLAADDDYAAEEADEFKKVLARPEGELTSDQRKAAYLLREGQDFERRYNRRKAADVERPAAEADVAAVARSKVGRSAVSLTKLFEGYASQPGINIREATVGQWRSIIGHLVAFLGHDDAAAVTDRDLIGWRNHLQREETKAGQPRSAKTINGSYLAAANVVFSYAKDEGAIATNPMRDLAKVRAGRVVKLREKDFTKAERKAVLSAALIAAGGKTSSERVAARRWVPWLCAYTGARVNEMTQLRAEDVQQQEGIWAIHITPEAGGVKTDEARWVPLHEHLIEQGFLAFVKGKSGALFYVPGGMARGTNKRVAMWLAEWVREIGITDKAIKPNHAWRHTFKTICTEMGIAERAADYMQGHASKGVGRTYGRNTMGALSAEFAKFPRFDFLPE